MAHADLIANSLKPKLRSDGETRSMEVVELLATLEMPEILAMLYKLELLAMLGMLRLLELLDRLRLPGSIPRPKGRASTSGLIAELRVTTSGL